MQYKYVQNENYEAYASGMILYHKPGFTNYPVRLSGEIFMRCMEKLEIKRGKAVLYDPCCGSAYMATVISFLCTDKIESIYCSDISEEAVSLSKRNLSLLTKSGISARKKELEELREKFGKDSHSQALAMIGEMEKNIIDIEANVFQADILIKNSLRDKRFKADIVITDVPYDRMAVWSDNSGGEVNRMLDNLTPVLNTNSVIAVSSNNRQKIHNNNFKRVDKILIGKRKIEFMQINRDL